MDFAPFLKEIGRGAKGARALLREQAATLFAAMLDGSLPDLELGAALIAFRIKGETVEELLGFKDALDAATVRLTVPAGPRCVVLPSYNSARRQPNLMPLVALSLARAGVPVLVQGLHGFDERESTMTLFRALDIPISNDIATTERDLARGHISAIGADTLVPGIARLITLRARMGVRSCVHTMVKLIDPCRERGVRVVAVTHREYMEKLAVLLSHEGGRALLMRGTEGEAYANPRHPPPMTMYVDGHAQALDTDAESPASSVPLASPATGDNIALIRAILAGIEPCPAPVQAQIAALETLARY
jgi:anthranilate phosphoribosyltransferase